MIGLFILKEAYWEAAFLIPLLFIIRRYHDYFQNKFRPIFKCASLTSACERDKEIKRWIDEHHEEILQKRAQQHKVVAGDSDITPSDLDAKGVYLPPIMQIDFSKTPK
ncbi:hypothetical protein RFI_02833 [Reticulomyxa filosa]|uniref:Uncharacterized protein n=1 Tax=Reticulomyxa filosa TaxID=46433 RepID=X6P7U7_RETFI|nr:hypothetical protein RFI_02833 [Reticulomyxa filosa]|eukprot:ETO34261.1 hypothetical protein RFI_02833 [Reticulomyxa filosa]